MTDNPQGTNPTAEPDETPHDRAAREFLASGMIAGPDPSVVDDVLTSADVSEVYTPTAEDDARMRTEVHRIYQQILTRAPEHDVQPSLDRVHDALDLLGAPHRSYPVIQVAGTNGKTSTARVIEQLLREKGLRTGRFTSPHLSDVRERIAIDGEPISPEAFIDVWEEVEPFVAMADERSRAAGGPRLSFFEVFTVMAYAAFAGAPVDVAVIETGMGGRWDATNVVDGAIAVLTAISRDHEMWLGAELSDIAREKAGIISTNATVITAEQREEVAAVIHQTSADQRAKLLQEGADMVVVDRQIGVGGQLLSLRTPAATYTDVFLPLHGAHQAHNALLGLTAVEQFFGGGALDAAVVEQGMGAVSSPGRLEVVRTSPTVIVDGAHNPASVEALRDALEEAFDLRRLVGVVGVMADKEAEAVLAGLEPFLAEIVVTTAATDRAMAAVDLAEIARDVFDEDRVHVAERLDEAIDLAVTRAEVAEEPGAGVVVTGSILLVAEARILLGRG